MVWLPTRKWVVAGILLGALVGGIQAKGTAIGVPVTAISLAELPKQGAQIHALILQGGPFAHKKDGSVFGNREQLLPAQKRGYYLEYTVPTPGAGNRGQRRIVCGGQAKAPDVCYYTADHYTSFRRIAP
jgi:ribonuclease T1